jgi:hypothetical protein
MMNYHNFKDEALIKRWWTTKKMNKMRMKLKDENKWNNHRKLFSFATRSRVFSQSSRIRKSMSVESTIVKLQKVAKDKET